MNFNCYGITLICLFALTSKFALADQPPAVVVSVKPVHSLVAAVAEGIFEPQLLVDGVASPHHFQMKPSAIRKLHKADQIFWIGEGLETFLIRALASLEDQNKSMKLIGAPDLTLLPLRTENFRNHQGARDGSADERIGADTTDFHIWLDPRNASALVGAIAERLTAIDAANASIYQANAVSIQHKLQQLETQVREILMHSVGQSFLVFHDSFQYFEKRFDLTAAGVISVHPDAQPGALRIRELQQQIGGESVRCLFSEPQFESRSVEMLVSDTSIKHAVIDPLAVAFDSGAEMYFKWLMHTAQVFSECLSPQ